VQWQGGPTSPSGGGPGGTIGASMPPGHSSSTNLPSRPGAQKCNHYLKAGSCKFGESCRYDHPPGEAASDPSAGARVKTAAQGPSESAANTAVGLPVRPGEKECSFFMKTGNCKFGEGCRWHHPPERQQDGGMAALMKMSMGSGGGGMGGMNPMAMMGALMGAMTPAAPSLPPMSRPPPPQPMMGHAGEWETHFSDNGRPYYFNVRTNVSLWDAPPEVLMQQMGMMGQQMGGGIKTPFDSGSAQGRSGGGPHPVRKFCPWFHSCPLCDPCMCVCKTFSCWPVVAGPLHLCA